MTGRTLVTMTGIATALFASACASNRKPPPSYALEEVAAIRGAMPTGVTIAPNGRLFINYPHWGDNPPFGVAEVRNGQVYAYPNAEINTPDPEHPSKTFISVQSVVADANNRLWVLDTAAPNFAAPLKGGAKLVAIDLASDAVVSTIVLPDEVVLPTTYLNDVRFDLRKGEAGVAYITDSSVRGPGAIIVVDLASGKAMRRLSGHTSTSPDLQFIGMVDGQSLMRRPADGPPEPMRVAADGIAISDDGKTLYYCPLSSRHLYSIPTALLRNEHASDDQVAAQVSDLGVKGASDGLAEDDRGRIYASDYENNAILKYENGRWKTLVQDPRISWPDTLSVGTDHYLYFTANQLHRQPSFNNGRDMRQQPYYIYRFKIDAGPVLLSDHR